MIGHDQRQAAVAEAVSFAAQFAEWRVGLEQLLSRDAADSNDNARLQQIDLRFEVTPAMIRFILRWIAIVGRPAFQHVGNEYFAARKTNRPQHLVQQFPGTADEGFAAPIFFRSRRLADDHPGRPLISRAEDRLRPALVQRTPRTPGDPLLEFAPAHCRICRRVGMTRSLVRSCTFCDITSRPDVDADGIQIGSSPRLR